MVKRRLIAALVLVVLGAMPALAAGATSGDDVLRGGNGPDLISGLAGNDRILGGHGPDVLRGGLGDDAIWTGKGGAHEGDAGYGGPGNDRIHNSGSGRTRGVTDGGPGWDRCTVDAREYAVRCEVVIVEA